MRRAASYGVVILNAIAVALGVVLVVVMFKKAADHAAADRLILRYEIAAMRVDMARQHLAMVGIEVAEQRLVCDVGRLVGVRGTR